MKSPPQTLFFLTFICLLFLNSETLSASDVSGQWQMGQTLLQWPALSWQPWEPQVSGLYFLGLQVSGWGVVPQNIWGLLEYILCVNGFQLLSLIILMWIKTQGNIFQRTVQIPCEILVCLWYFVGMFYGLENFYKGVFFFFFVMRFIYYTRNLTCGTLIQTLYSQIVHEN